MGRFTHERSDHELLHQTRTGDTEAFGVFYRRHGSKIFAYLLRNTRRRELAADLLGETFSAALLAVRQGGAQDLEHPLAWLMRIAHNKLIDFQRRRRLENTMGRMVAMRSPLLVEDDFGRIDDASARDVAWQALQRLSPRQREAVHARIIDERDYAEIADSLSCSPAVVRQRVSRGLRGLKSAMSGG